MQNSNTQKFIDKYCECIDIIIGKWGRHEEKFAIYRFAKKAEFLHYLLMINEKFEYPRNLFTIDLGFHSYDLSKFSHDPDYCRDMSKQLEARKKHVLECQRLALSISSPIKEIESGHYNKDEIREEKLNDLLFTLKQIKKSIDSNSPIEMREGKEANRLAIDMGLICKWYPLLVKVRITTKNNKLPYDEPEHDIYNVLSLDGRTPYSEFEINNNKSWIEKTRKLLSELNNEQDSIGIPQEFRSSPLSLKSMASLIGGDMTRKKLSQMVEKNILRAERINRQTFIFDISKFPPEVQAKAKR